MQSRKLLRDNAPYIPIHIYRNNTETYMDSVLGHLHALLAFGQVDCYSTLAASISSRQISSTDVAQAVCTYIYVNSSQPDCDDLDQWSAIYK